MLMPLPVIRLFSSALCDNDDCDVEHYCCAYPFYSYLLRKLKKNLNKEIKRRDMLTHIDANLY